MFGVEAEGALVAGVRRHHQPHGATLPSPIPELLNQSATHTTATVSRSDVHADQLRTRSDPHFGAVAERTDEVSDNVIAGLGNQNQSVAVVEQVSAPLFTVLGWPVLVAQRIAGRRILGEQRRAGLPNGTDVTDACTPHDVPAHGTDSSGIPSLDSR